MVVMILERVPSGLRGEISRWMIEPRAGVFVGKLSAMVRDRLWEKASKSARDGAGILLHTSSSEQGFNVQTFGDTSRELMNMEGVWLVRLVKKRSC